MFFTSRFRERASGELVADVRHADPYHPEADFWSNSAKNLAVFPEKWIRRAIGLSLVKSQPKTGKAGANPSQQDVASAVDQSQPQQEPQSATSEALPVTLPPAAASPSPSPAETRVETTPVQEGGTDATPRPVVLDQDGGAATPDKVPEGGGAQHDEAPAVTPAAPRPKALGRHEHGLRQPARPQPQPTFWQRLFGRKEAKEAKPGKPRL